MIFYLKRYFAALWTRRKWMMLAFVPLFIYLVFAALRDDGFIVMQDFSYEGEIAIPAANTPDGVSALWNPNRLLPALVVFFISLLILMLLVGMLELLDPSFKSERQIARYLDLPVLGAIPNAEPLMRNLK